jgi:hypothetical protein
MSHRNALSTLYSNGAESVLLICFKVIDGSYYALSDNLKVFTLIQYSRLGVTPCEYQHT